MKTSSLTLIPASSFGDDIVGTPQKGVAYYAKDKSVQTISWAVTGFVGVITIEATLDELNDTDNYLPIIEIGYDGMAPLTMADFVNQIGRYTWIKATVTNFTAGSIESVTLGY